MSKLIITEEGRDKIYEIVDDEFTIGRAAGASCPLRDPSAEPVHLTVKKTKTGYRIIDMETKSGTRVNGKTVNEHLLANGDTIEIGGVKITFIGKGPARAAAKPAAAARRGSGEAIAKRTYRHDTWDDKLSPMARLGIALGALAVLFLIFWLMLRTTQVKVDEFDIEIRWAKAELDAGSKNFAEVRRRLALAEKFADEESERKELRAVRARLGETEAQIEGTGRAIEAEKIWISFDATRLQQPDNIVKLKRLGEEFLQKYDDLDLRYEAKVREVLAGIRNEVSPEKMALGTLFDEVDQLYNQKEYRKAYDALLNADGSLRALYAEEIEKWADKLRKRSRQVLSPRKNDARHALREGKPREARELIVDMFDKLILKTIEDYLRSPDKGYDNPEIDRLELETQKLMKEVMAERKGGR